MGRIASIAPARGAGQRIHRGSGPGARNGAPAYHRRMISFVQARVRAAAAPSPRRRAGLLWLAALLAPGVRAAAAEPARVLYPRHASMPDPQRDYMVSLLSLALRHVDRAYTPEPLGLEMAQQRTMLEIARGDNPLDLMWTMTDPEREAGPLLPVRIPVDRGLLGWRLLLVRRDELPMWREVRDLARLRTLMAGQGHDWPDTRILRANGLPVGTSSSYESLFRMLARGRIDYFPRAIGEIDSELAAHDDAGLAIAPGLMLYYPTASYFFVSPRRPELAEHLRLGLEAAVADGSMARLFEQHYGALLARHRTRERRVIRLANPLLPPLTPLQRRELWQQPEG